MGEGGFPRTWWTIQEVTPAVRNTLGSVPLAGVEELLDVSNDLGSDI